MKEVPKPLVDKAARDRAASDLGTSFCVEAGAGTGKTTLLVDRFMSIVASGEAPCSRIVAITFTEKAAGEMKIRLRRELLKRLGAPELEERVRKNLEAASVELERAPISTIHSFAAAILREHPIEAGIDPDFTQLDALESSLFFDECWNDFLLQMADEWGEALRGFISFGGSVGNLRSMADELYRRRAERSCENIFGDDGRRGLAKAEANESEAGKKSLSGGAARAAELTTVSRLRDSFACAAERLASLARDHCVSPADRGGQAIAHFIEEMRGLDMLPGDDLAYVLLTLSLPKNKGSKENWRPAEACTEQKGVFKGLAALQDIERKRYADGMRDRLEAFLEALLAFIERRKIESGILDFDDLLIKVRELCKDPDALDRLRERYRYILVDEFQDTDPVQAEIVYLIAGAPGSRDRLELEPGKLFVVGDPKQSIYRFRKADVEMYERVKERLSLSGERLSITQNFRSVPGIIEWVNDTFSRIMLPPEEGAFQPRYESIHPFRSEQDVPPVVLFDLELDEKDALADNIRRREGEAVARLIRRLLEGGLAVTDAGTKTMRSLQYGDIAVLYPGTTGIDHYEEPLRAENIPYIIEGGKLFYAREEIRDLASVIWAIEDPYDSLALVGSLRSPIFGFSDEELFLFTRKGERLNYLDRSPGVLEEFGDLASAFDLLTGLHFDRNELGPTRTILELLRRTKYVELSLLRPHGEQRVSNIKKAVSSARSFEGRVHSYRRFARWFRDQEMLASPESESPIVEEGENAVRLLTVHKAKGLQFPVVILANLIQSTRSSPRILVERGRNLSFKLGALLETSDYAVRAEREKLRETAETIRLLYVAATRAGDLLVIPRMPKGGNYFDLIKSPLCEDGACPSGGRPGRTSRSGAAGAGGRSNEAETRYGAVWKLSDLPPLRGESRPFVRLEGSSPEELRKAAEERTEWINGRASLLDRARRAPLVLAPSRFAGEAIKFAKGIGAFEAPGAPEAVPRNRSLLFGLAFHRVMELADFSGARPPGDVVSSAASEFGIEEEIPELERCASSALASEIIARAAHAARFFREVPFVLHLDGNFVEGRIDLLFEEKGRWMVVDYKTDDTTAGAIDERIEAYHAQAGIYALALEHFGIALTGGVFLYFVRPNIVKTVPFSSELRGEAQRLIREAAITRGSAREPSRGQNLQA